ncbi:hypothetical protein ACPA9J_19095 [Pseudomonas aeruginosa]
MFAVIDASGTCSKMARNHLARVVQAGVVPMDTAAVCSKSSAPGTATTPCSSPAYSAVFPALPTADRGLRQGPGRGQRKAEQLDSQRGSMGRKGCTPLLFGAWWTATTTDRTHA